MITYRVIHTLLLIFFTGIDLAKTAANHKLAKIIGGNSVDIRNYNYLVSVQFHHIHFCGGVIIDKRNIISAAHCFTFPFNDTKVWSIYAGSSFLNDELNPKTQIVQIDTITLHPDFKEIPYLENDIAILTLKTDLILSNTVQPINLPSDNFNLINWSNVEVSGWGTTKIDSNDLPHQLNSAVVRVIDFRICNRRYYFRLNFKNMLCAGDLAGTKDSCAGDSGGPLVMRKNNEWVLVGIVSWGYSCANPFYPGVYVKISSFTEWIHMVNQTTYAI